jgi:signal transduction histidine kinase
MVVDDDPDHIELMRRILLQAGYSEIISTSDPEQAVALFRKALPDILLLDIATPTLEGLPVIEQLGDRMDAHGVLVPLLIITADVSPEVKRKAFAGGADDLLVKPFENEEVVARVKNLLEARRLHIELMTYNERLEREVTSRTDALRESESSLLQAQKMDAVGQLAGGIAHDFNNLLSVIIGYAGLLADDTTEEDPTHPDLLEIRNAGMRAASLTRQLLAFSRKEVVLPIVLDLNNVIANIETLLRRTIRGNIDLRMQLARKLPHVKVDVGQLEQVLVNLVVNARDAIEAAGTIHIRTREANLDDDFVARHPGATAGSYVAIEVTDDGGGMTDEVKDKLFEPFFTTKERGLGTGLGLATVYGIVKQAGGYIELESALGRGTTFTVYLPATEEALDVKSPTVEVERIPGEGQSILVAEDQAVVRQMVEKLLTRNGFKVTAVATGEQARQFIESDEGSIDLLLSDVVMPGISGVTLARDVNATWPHIPVVLMSGYTDQELGDPSIKVELLRKPFTQDELLRSVAVALHRAGRIP